MKVFCALLVSLVVLQVAQCRDFGRRSHRVRNFFNPRQRADVTPSIVGGDPATIEQFPHHLGLLDLSWGGYICGASNIHPRYALSAAHCLYFNVPASEINLWGGSTSRISGGTVFFVQEYILHPQYDDWLLDNDIAVIHVHESTPLGGPNVSPIPLPPNCAAACCGVCVDGPPITVIGWGVYILPNTLPENLRQVQKPIFDHADCDAIWGDITPSMFCTAVSEGRDSCNGDSGGSIIREGIHVGLVSFGTAVCGSGAAPAVYVRIEHPPVRDFIRTVAGI